MPMNSNRKNQHEMNDTTRGAQQEQGQNTGPGESKWDQIAAKLSGVADRPAGQAHEQGPAREEASKGQPDASEVDRLTAAVKEAWGLGAKGESRETATEPSQ